MRTRSHHLPQPFHHVLLLFTVCACVKDKSPRGIRRSGHQYERGLGVQQTRKPCEMSLVIAHENILVLDIFENQQDVSQLGFYFITGEAL